MLRKFNGIFQKFPFKRKEQYERHVETIKGINYLVREVHTDDIKGLLDVERKVYAGEVPWTKSAFLSELISPLKHLYLCVEHQSLLIGFIGCRITANDGHVTNFAVLPEYQSKGVGSFLLGEVEEFARKNGCDVMSLEVRLSNRDAQRLYRKFGYVSRAIKTEYYNETNEDALDMVKYINE